MDINLRDIDASKLNDAEFTALGNVLRNNKSADDLAFITGTAQANALRAEAAGKEAADRVKALELEVQTLKERLKQHES